MPLNVQCKRCANLKNGWCESVIDSPDPDLNRDCQHFRIKSNYDKIRAMTIEEMAKTFADYISCHNCPFPYCEVRFTVERLKCQANWLDWMRQEALP